MTTRRPARMLLAPLALLSAFSLLAPGCVSGSIDEEDPGEPASLTGGQRAVTLRTAVGGKYVVAENGGGGVVNANRDSASTWETFSLYDLNGGALVSGDLVALAASNGQFVCAENGGGGAVNANRAVPQDWETFRVGKIGGSGAINNGDQISLQTKTRGNFLSALNGGGSSLTADRTAVSGWESFVVGMTSGGSSGSGGCSGAQLAKCNCPSGFSCCPTDGSCFAKASDVIYTQCKDNPASTCVVGGTTNPAPTPNPPAPNPPTPNPPSNQTTRLRVTSHCADPIWIAHSDNVPDTQNVILNNGQSRDYVIPGGGLSAARFWPKFGCDGGGHNCKMGDNGEGGGKPCPLTGCQPPLDSKFEVSFAANGSGDQTWYNLSQVDGYTLPFKVTPHGNGAEAGSCVSSDCSRLSLNGCPGDENISGGGAFPQYAHEDLRVRDSSGKVIACMAPCKKWNYPAPYGLGQSEGADPGLHMCCPTPIDPASGQCTVANHCMTSQSCNAAGDPRSVVHTSYVAAIHSMCPSAYSFAYDDAAGLHACPSDTTFEVTFCP